MAEEEAALRGKRTAGPAARRREPVIGGREGRIPTALQLGGDVVRRCGGPATPTLRWPGDPTSVVAHSRSGQRCGGAGRRGAWPMARKVRRIQIGVGGATMQTQGRPGDGPMAMQCSMRMMGGVPMDPMGDGKR